MGRSRKPLWSFWVTVSSNLTLSVELPMSVRCVDCLNEAIERCEVTSAPLCAEHLWYTDGGRRVSERVARQLEAKGEVIHSPSKYLEQLGGALALPRLPVAPQVEVTQLRNGNDIMALLALVSGVITLATCFGIGIALCLPPLPLASLILGVIGLAGSKSATRPPQARMFSWVGIIAGAGFVLLMLTLIGVTLAAGSSSLFPTLYRPGVIPVATP